MTNTTRTRRMNWTVKALLAAVASATVGGAVLLAADAPALVNPTAAGGAKPSEYVAKASTAPAGDMTMWGGTPHRNMISAEKNAPTEWEIGDPEKPGVGPDAKNIKWVAKLGSKSYGNPIITNGKVFVGTNNAAKYDKKYTTPAGDEIDGGVFAAFDEKTGKFLWQRYYSKLPSGRVNDWPGEGLCSTAYTEGDRVWYCNNRCEVVCLDTSASEPREIWKVDMMAKLGVFPHNMTSAAIASHGDLIYVITGNGVDDTHKNVVAPQAPGIVCFNKNTGEVKWTDNSPGGNVLHGQWSSVAITEVNGRAVVIAALGDAWVYCFDAKTGEHIWKFDANPKDSVYPQTRNEIIATPVIVGNRLYISTGQDPEHGQGDGIAWCIQIDKTGDISEELPSDAEAAKPKPGEELVAPAGKVPSRKGKPNPNSGVVWKFDKQDMNGDGKIQAVERMHRTISTFAVHNGLAFIPDFNGILHCLDADTGKQYWAKDLESEVWGSCLVVDGKVYVGDGDGKVHIFEESKTAKEIASHDMGSPVFGTPVMSNGTLYIMAMHNLFAIGGANAGGAGK